MIITLRWNMVVVENDSEEWLFSVYDIYIVFTGQLFCILIFSVLVM